MKKNVIVVTGGTSGIGADVVRSYLSNDHIVYAIGKTQKHCDLLKLNYKNSEFLHVIQADLTIEKQAMKVIEKIKDNERSIDFLVNSVGTISSGGIIEESFEEWNRVIQNNLNTLFVMTKLAIPLLKKGTGKSIVNVSSVCSIRPCSSLSYSVSKSGTDMFTKVLAKELAPMGIRVNSVNPGVVISNLQKSAGLFNNDNEYNEWIEKMKPMHPLNRVGNPNDISDAIVFLNSTQSKWITGSILSVDGGRAL